MKKFVFCKDCVFNHKIYNYCTFLERVDYKTGQDFVLRTNLNDGCTFGSTKKHTEKKLTIKEWINKYINTMEEVTDGHI